MIPFIKSSETEASLAEDVYLGDKTKEKRK